MNGSFQNIIDGVRWRINLEKLNDNIRENILLDYFAEKNFDKKLGSSSISPRRNRCPSQTKRS
jgi:hypothetical protein